MITLSYVQNQQQIEHLHLMCPIQNEQYELA